MTDTGQPRIPARIHDEAGRWLARRQGDVHPEVEREFVIWIGTDPRHRRAYEEAGQHWRDSLVLGRSEIGRRRRLVRAPFLMRRSTQVGAAGLGLAAILGLVTVGLVQPGGPFALVSPAEAAVYRTGVGEIRTVRLADGSLVTLDTATLVRVTFTTGSRRLVLERGRARFRAAPDSRRPFVVAVPGGEIVARGAAFDVSVTERTAKIAAVGGPVDLRGLDSGTGPKTLTAGKQTAFGGSAAPKPISQAEVRWVSGMLGLDATPLGEAVASINRYNGMQVRLADERLATLLITGAFRARDPQEFARAVAATFDLEVDRSREGQITLTPRHRLPASSSQK